MRKWKLANESSTATNINASQFALDDPDGVIKNLADVIRKRIDTFNPHRRKLLVEAKANISYLVGEQDIELLGDHIVALPKERAINSTVNVLLPAVQKDIAVATSRPPAFDIVPAGTDDDDKATALVCQKAYKHIQRMNGKDMKRGEAVLWYDLTGVGWRKTFWNPTAKVVGINPPAFDDDDNPIESHIQGMEVGQALVEGEVEIICVPTTQLIYDFRADLKKLPWIIHAKKVTSAWVMSNFGAEIHNKLSSEFNIPKENAFETRIMNRFTDTYQSSGDGQQRMVTPAMYDTTNIKLKSDQEIDYYEYWHKPTNANPTGNYAVMLGTQVVYHQPYPIDDYPHGELPFTPNAPIQITGATTGGICRISQTRPLQRKFNKLCSQIDDNIDVMGNAVIITPRAAKLKFRTLDNQVGNIIEYDGPVGRPHREPGVPMNSQVFVYLNTIKTAIDEIFAFHGAMKGQPPKNIDSGKGIQALQQSDIEHLGPIVEDFEEGDQRVLYQALTLMAANYKQGRMINVVGSDYEWTLLEWDPQQLKGKFNVIVKHRSSMPLDKDASGQRIFDLWGSGLLGDPQDPELRVWVMNQMQLGNSETILQKHSKQRNFAMKEFAVAFANLKKIDFSEVATSEELAKLIQEHTFVPSINPFDDHVIHILCHKEYLLDKYWEFKSTGNPLLIELLNNFGNHLNEHIGIMSEMKQAQYERDLLTQMLLKKATPAQIMMQKSKPAEPKKEKK